MKIFSEGSIFSSLGSVAGARLAAIISIIMLAIVLIIRITQFKPLGIVKLVTQTLLSLTRKFIRNKETVYHRNLAIGKIDEQRRTVKAYRFINDLLIDLGLRQHGATPYEFIFLLIVGSIVFSLLLCQLLFGSIWLSILLFPVTFAGTLCGLYTKANIAHDTRIEAIIEAENILCANIKDGVVVAVRNSIDLMPQQVKEEFKDFLDNIEHKNYHIKTALQELNNQLGSTADDFIKKCIVFEMEEEHGIVGMFSDVVEINNIKMQMRIEMKRSFEKEVTKFIIGSVMIFVFLGGVLAIFKDVADMYFKTYLGQTILCIDLFIVIGEFVYITYLRAKEL